MALVVCSLLGLAGWGWLLRRTVRSGAWRAPAGDWHLGDAIFGGAISLYFIATLFGDDGEEMVLTPDAIRASVIVCGILIFLVAGVVVARGRSLQAAFGLGPRNFPRAAAAGVLCIALAYPVLELLGRLVGLISGPVNEADQTVQYFRGALAPADRAWMIMLVVVAAPLAEELLFRGYLYGVIRRYGGRIWAALTSALLFAAVHQNLPALPVYFLLALSLTAAYEVTGSLWAPIAMHALFNSATVVIILWFPQWMQ